VCVCPRALSLSLALSLSRDKERERETFLTKPNCKGARERWDSYVSVPVRKLSIYLSLALSLSLSHVNTFLTRLQIR